MSGKVAAKDELIGFSYIRSNCDEINKVHNLSLAIPKVIILIIIEYFKSIFEWDAEKCCEDVIISNNNLNIRCEVARNRTCLAKNLLSSNEYSQVIWEITIIDTDPDNYLCVAMGYVEYQEDIKKSIKSYEVWLGSNEYQCSMYIDAWTESQRFTKHFCGLETDYDQRWLSANVTVNDRLKIQFDFVKKECSFYWNDEFVAILHDRLPDKIYPALSCGYVCEYECTKWELFYNKHL